MKLKAVPKAEVEVRVDGVAIEEYPDEADHRSSDVLGVKYVEASPNSTFTVHVRANRRHLRSHTDAITCIVSIDGVKARSYVFSKFEADDTVRKSVRGVKRTKAGQTTLERFKFANLETSDSSSVGLSTADFKHLGEIEVTFTVVRVVSRTARGNDSHKFMSVVSGSVPEKCLKGRAISQVATLGNPEPSTRSGSKVDVAWPYGKEPYATFIFKYRSRRDLQIEGLISRDPTPIPLEDRKVEDLSLLEARERIRHLERVQRERDIRVKAEKRQFASVIADDADRTNDMIIKMESSQRKRQRVLSSAQVEVLDLTGDD